MEIDNYRNFLAIVEAGSMTSASEFVHIAQPALSKQLKSLEGYFGTKLIITTRGSKHLILTDAGKILYHKAKYICSLEDMARIEIDDISDGNRGTLRISAANSRSSIFIKTCLEPFHDLFPNVVYEIYEGSVNEQSQQLLSGITELGILSVPLIHQNDFEILFQREEDICAIFSKNSKFLTDIGNKETVSIKDLASLPLCASAGCNLIGAHFRQGAAAQGHGGAAVKPLAFRGQRDAMVGTDEQLAAQILLQVVHAAGNVGLVIAQHPRRAGKVLVFCHIVKDLVVFPVYIHGCSAFFPFQYRLMTLYDFF